MLVRERARHSALLTHSMVHAFLQDFATKRRVGTWFNTLVIILALLRSFHYGFISSFLHFFLLFLPIFRGFNLCFFFRLQFCIFPTLYLFVYFSFHSYFCAHLSLILFKQSLSFPSFLRFFSLSAIFSSVDSTFLTPTILQILGMNFPTRNG